MDKMDLTNYSNYFAIPIAAQSKKVNQELVLDCDISYYTVQEGQKKLALQLVKGTRVLWLPTDELYNLYVGYGLRGYPTYEKGWRYVKPFMISSQPSELEQLPYYFVKTADLETVTRQVFKDDASLLNSLQNRMLSIEDVTFLYPRFIDKLFYDNGVFCSPDLQRPIWERIDWILMGMLIVFVLMSWIFRHRQILSMRQSNK